MVATDANLRRPLPRLAAGQPRRPSSNPPVAPWYSNVSQLIVGSMIGGVHAFGRCCPGFAVLGRSPVQSAQSRGDRTAANHSAKREAGTTARCQPCANFNLAARARSAHASQRTGESGERPGGHSAQDKQPTRKPATNCHARVDRRLCSAHLARRQIVRHGWTHGRTLGHERHAYPAIRQAHLDQRSILPELVGRRQTSGLGGSQRLGRLA